MKRQFRLKENFFFLSHLNAAEDVALGIGDGLALLESDVLSNLALDVAEMERERGRGMRKRGVREKVIATAEVFNCKHE
jgi:hypothetical protein